MGPDLVPGATPDAAGSQGQPSRCGRGSAASNTGDKKSRRQGKNPVRRPIAQRKEFGSVLQVYAAGQYPAAATVGRVQRLAGRCRRGEAALKQGHIPFVAQAARLGPPKGLHRLRAQGRADQAGSFPVQPLQQTAKGTDRGRVWTGCADFRRRQLGRERGQQTFQAGSGVAGQGRRVQARGFEEKSVVPLAGKQTRSGHGQGLGCGQRGDRRHKGEHIAGHQPVGCRDRATVAQGSAALQATPTAAQPQVGQQRSQGLVTTLAHQPGGSGLHGNGRHGSGLHGGSGGLWRIHVHHTPTAACCGTRARSALAVRSGSWRAGS